ncbi:zinc finger protein 84 isoform X1 [Plutella xylostella]|uniref:zinc finger protein 84 isoform X1 n=1 Tax=Plutella xylostella TaxID=51655 RepID=UPI002032C4EF|nr:zinc finger protein 84 isoform X1 [Plutella xylostella]
MGDSKKFILDMNSCRICLVKKKPLCPLFKYKLSGNYAEMLTAIADVKVASNDGLPDKICTKCCTALEKAFLLKTVAERTDKLLQKNLSKILAKRPTKKISFDSLTDIKSEIGPLNIKNEPKWEMEIEVLGDTSTKAVDSVDGKDIVIANTVIRKFDGKSEDVKNDFFNDDVDISWKTIKTDPKSEDGDVEYLDDNFFQDDDYDDQDYVPPKKEKGKTKFKKPKLSDIKVYKEKKVLGKVKVIKQESGEGKANLITCYPVTKNGSRGAPILLKRPKDATILKVHPNYKSKKPGETQSRVPIRDKPLRVVRSAKPAPTKQKEKLVCPVCGILTFTLGNHMTTHQEKKKYSCTECTKTFSQKTNLQIHMKQHSGIKDHICEICGAGFYCQKGLLRHNLIHKGERPFGCTLCPKRFIARCDLNRHLRIHSGYKPYKCNVCTMSFNAKHQLQNHERMHTGERPYTCQVCNVSFSYKVNLNNHVFKFHGINLKFKSIHVVTEEILRREMDMAGEARIAISNILPSLDVAPPPAAHETVAGDY